MVQTKDGEFRVELDRPPPQQEIEFCEGKIKEQEKEKLRLEKELEKKLKDREAILYISLEDKDGEVIPFVVDGETFERMWFDVDGDNFMSYLAQAQVHLRNALGSPKNDRTRMGALIHACDKQIVKYKERIERAARHVRAQGGRG